VNFKTFLVGNWTVLISMVAVCWCGCDRRPPATASKPPPPATVKVTHARKGEATRSITLPANVLAYQQATLYAKVAGYVKSVSVDKGDRVEAGVLLAELEVPELLADRAKYKAELEYAALEFKRVQDAQAKAPDLVMAQAVDVAKSKAAVAKANLEQVETSLSFARITAPFAGIITKRMIDPGAFIPAATSGNSANAALFTLMDFSKVRVQVAVPEAEVPLIKTGLAAKIAVEELPNSSFEGTITRYSHALDESTKTMLAEIELPNPKGELRPGMYATARIIVERKPDVLVIPSEALVLEKTRQSVFTVVDQRAKRLPVKVGFNEAGWAEVNGVQENQPLILVGKQVLVDGQPIIQAEGK
jgi:membrane fusion protein, multidrug efflux system